MQARTSEGEAALLVLACSLRSLITDQCINQGNACTYPTGVIVEELLLPHVYGRASPVCLTLQMHRHDDAVTQQDTLAHLPSQLQLGRPSPASHILVVVAALIPAHAQHAQS